jgi:hypothetical protein
VKTYLEGVGIFFSRFVKYEVGDELRLGSGMIFGVGINC